MNTKPKAAGKARLKEYQPGGVSAHLIMQQSPYVQRVLAAVGREAPKARKALVKYERGKTIESLAGTPFLIRNRFRVLDQLADALVNHLWLGVVHGDIHSGNIVVSRGMQVKIIDYARAKPLTRETIKNYEKIYRSVERQHGEIAATRETKEAIDRQRLMGRLMSGEAAAIMEMKEAFLRMYLDPLKAERRITADYPFVIEYVIPSLAKDAKDREKLKRYFEKKFLERVGRL